MKACPKCKQTSQGDFCIHCGVEVKELLEHGICKGCGTQSMSNALFCYKCGQRLGVADIPRNEAKVTPNSLPFAATPLAPKPKSYVAGTSRKALTIFSSVAALLVVSTLFIIIVAAPNRSSSNNEGRRSSTIVSDRNRPRDELLITPEDSRATAAGVTIEEAQNAPGVYIRMEDSYFRLETQDFTRLDDGSEGDYATLFYDLGFQAQRIPGNADLVLVGQTYVSIYQSPHNGYSIPYGVDWEITRHSLTVDEIIPDSKIGILKYDRDSFNNYTAWFETLNGKAPNEYVSRMVFTRAGLGLYQKRGILSASANEEFSFGRFEGTVYKETIIVADKMFFMYGIDNGYHFGDQGAKFKDFGMSETDIFTSVPSNWSNGGWTGNSGANLNVGTYIDLTFSDGMNWNSFVADYAEALKIYAHVQAIGQSGQSINQAVFTYAPAPVPEPATLAVLGLGLAGIGIARRRMKK